MTVTPANILSLPVDNARTLIANCGAWQTWTGAADAAAAKAFIHAGEEDGVPTRPFCLVSLAAFAMPRIGDGGRNQFRESGSVLLTFRDDVSESDETDAYYDFLNNMGAVISDDSNDGIRQLAGTGGYLDVRAVTLEALGGVRRSTKKQGEGTIYYEAIVRLDYGRG